MKPDDPDMDTVIRAMVAGALDHFQWPVKDEELQRLIVEAEQREEIWRREASQREIASQQIKLLTVRERQVLALISRGLSNKLIAKNLSISPRTVEVHRANLYEKINAQSTADAVRIGIQSGVDQDG